MTIRVMYVCLGNICRSPAAEALLRHLLEQEELELFRRVHIESSGTGSWHSGELPNPRMQTVLQKRGVCADSKAQQFESSDYEQFNYIFVATQEILDKLQESTLNEEHKDKVYLMTHFSKQHQGKDVPDPYYGKDEGFDKVVDMLEESCLGFIEELKRRKQCENIF